MRLDHFGLIARFYDRVFHFLGPERLMGLLQPQPSERTLDIGGGTGRVSPKKAIPDCPSHMTTNEHSLLTLLASLAPVNRRQHDVHDVNVPIVIEIVAWIPVGICVCLMPASGYLLDVRHVHHTIEIKVTDKWPRPIKHPLHD